MNYNRDAAVGYAVQFTDKYAGYTKYNRDGFGYIETNGSGNSGDCANYVSQCLWAGGLPMTTAWYNNTPYSNPGIGITTWNGTNSLRLFLINRGWASHIDCIGVILYCAKMFFNGWSMKKDHEYEVKINGKTYTIGQGTNSAITFNVPNRKKGLKNNIIPSSTSSIESVLKPGMILYNKDLGHVGVYVGFYVSDDGKIYLHGVVQSANEESGVIVSNVEDTSFVYYTEYNYIDYDVTYEDTLPPIAEML